MTSRKNILILMHNTIIQFVDIANQYVKLFDPARYKVTVAYLSGEQNQEVQQKTLAEEVIFLNFSKKKIRALKITAMRKLILLCRQEKFSMVIAHRYKPIYVMLWTAYFCPIPTIIFVMHAMKTIQHLNRKILIATLFRKNMYFAGVSDAVRDDLRRSLFGIPHEKIITLYNCIDIDSTKKSLLSRSQARKTLQLTEDALIIGTIGRLVREKDQQNIIRAFAKIYSQIPQAKLIIMGNGPLEQDLKQLTAQLGMTNAVIFTGFITEASRYLKAFDIFVLSSTKEAFGRVLLEAMVAKIPLIGTQTDGIPEVISDAGYLVAPRNCAKLATAMKELSQLTALERADWGEKGYARAKKHFSLEKFNEDFWQGKKLLTPL